ncbi:AP2 domain transcription factor AP2XII-6 [Toxoplasma gondii MAS]|uniref:AP2 domain transcription factor AP2XII-6 n=2 Tax=Toxoplasma gondii TaxID=5811 RepID=A0A086QDK0_TOXGO|nr:AP2 domain transcription factor AP2XII-6 [Toxoplasma gondii MAS]PUA90777.1 AP2 domain transcription factor AP2XII-6 [Toxoplasma gondii TgCATBr9]
MPSAGGHGDAMQVPAGHEDGDYFSRKQRLLAVLFQSVVTGPVAHEAARAHLGPNVLAACTGKERFETSMTGSPTKSGTTTVNGGSDRRAGANAYRTTHKSRAASRAGGRGHNLDEGNTEKNRSRCLHVTEHRRSATVASENETPSLPNGNEGCRKRKFYDEQLPVGVYRQKQKYVANWIHPKTRRQIKVSFPIDLWGDSQARKMAVIARRERCMDVGEVESLLKREERNKTSRHQPVPSGGGGNQISNDSYSAVSMAAVQRADLKTGKYHPPDSALEDA